MSDRQKACFFIPVQIFLVTVKPRTYRFYDYIAPGFLYPEKQVIAFALYLVKALSDKKGLEIDPARN